MRLIDAHKLQKAFYEHKSVRSVTKETIIGIIKEQPIVDPVKHGRWIERRDGELLWDECSTCGYVNEYERFPYCPNCGAKMGGDEE